MNASEKTELTSSIRHIERFSKSVIPICNSEAPKKMGPKPQVTTKRYVLQVNTKIIIIKDNIKLSGFNKMVSVNHKVCFTSYALLTRKFHKAPKMTVKILLLCLLFHFGGSI